MQYIGFFILLTVILSLYIYKILQANLSRVNKKYAQKKKEYEGLQATARDAKEQVHALEGLLKDTVALYDITKEICKYLDEEKVFHSFKEEINKYIELENCRFIKTQAEMSFNRQEAFLPLRLNKALAGYLVADKVKGQDKEKFNILAHQFLLGIKRAILYQRIQELVITDTLTGAFSRRYCLERLKEEVGRSEKFKYHFSCLMADVDHFKEHNDRYGHLVGDAVLREVCEMIKERVRQIDLVARYGGEEFFIILPETDKAQAVFAAERIRESIEKRIFKVYDEDLKVTISIGVSTFPDDSAKMQGLVDRADEALYQAKERGRNRVCVYGIK